MNNNITYFLLPCTFIFIAIFTLGILVVPNVVNNMHEQVTFDDLRITSINSPFIPSFTNLLIRNLVVSIGIICMGVFGTPIIPILYLCYHSLYFGEVVQMLNKPDTYLAILSLLPHGIIEIPALILCTCISCNFSRQLQLYTGNKGFKGILLFKGDVKPVVWKSGFLPYIKYVLPLIVIAALVECTISIYILRALFNNGV